MHEPLPRNPRLYGAAKRIGLVEQTGRSVDKVYLGQLRYGRPAPDYSRSDATGVRLTLRGPMTVEQMIVLNRLFHDRRVTTEQVAIEIQRSLNEARALLERLVEEGLVEARGEKRGRVYHLAARFYNTVGRPEAYVHVHGVEPLRQEALVEEYVLAHGSIRRAKAAELCGISERQATLS